MFRNTNIHNPFYLFLVSRVIGTYLLRFLRSSKLLIYFAIFAMLFSAGIIRVDGVVGLYCLVGVSFSMSLMFPAIYGIALDGLNEEESKIGATGLVMAIIGGALMPQWQGYIIYLGGSGVADTKIMGVEVNFYFILPLFFLYIAWYGLRAFKKYETADAVIS